MDFTTPLLVVGGAGVVLIILLTGLCLNCKESSQRKYIQQHPRSQSTHQGFTIVRPNTENTFTILPTSPHISSPGAGPRGPSPCPSSDGGSQSDYINQQVDKDQSSYEEPPEKNDDYIVVLPDDQIAPPKNVTTSSLNSGESYQNIEDHNVVDDDDDDDYLDSQNYINIKDKELAIPTPVGSFASCSSDGQGSSDYVNAPKQVNIHL